MGSGCGTVEGSFIKAGELSQTLDAFTPASPWNGHTSVQTGFSLSTKGLDANNTIKTQKSTNNGYSWSDVTTYNSDQNNVQVVESTERVVGANEYAIYRLVCVTKEALSVNGKPIQFKMTRERPTNSVDLSKAYT